MAEVDWVKADNFVLGPYIGTDQKVPVVDLQTQKRYRTYPVTAREGIAIGRVALDTGEDAIPEPEVKSLASMGLEELKAQFHKALGNGVQLPNPRGTWGSKKYAEVLQEVGWKPV